VQLSSKITYFLWAGDGRDEVSGSFCSYRARSHTLCRWVMGETKSAGCSAAIKQDHVLPVGGRWERRSQRVVLQLSSKITYFLWVGDGRDKVSGLFCSCRARSCTICRWVMGETKSAGCCAAVEQDHVLSVGGRWERRSQWVILQLLSKIMYSL
jgi:hypothetical protein